MEEPATAESTPKFGVVKESTVKSLARIVLFIAVILAVRVSIAQQPQTPPPAPDPSAPALTLEEKITLGTDDIKKGDILERLQKQFQADIKPIQEHQDAAKAVIEKEHPGWLLQSGSQGWQFVKKPEPPKKPAEPAKAPEPPKK